MDYLLCGDLPYPAWKKHISVQNLNNRRIRRYLVCRLKRPEARDFSHVRFTLIDIILNIRKNRIIFSGADPVIRELIVYQCTYHRSGIVQSLPCRRVVTIVPFPQVFTGNPRLLRAFQIPLVQQINFFIRKTKILTESNPGCHVVFQKHADTMSIVFFCGRRKNGIPFLTSYLFSGKTISFSGTPSDLMR